MHIRIQVLRVLVRGLGSGAREALLRALLRVRDLAPELHTLELHSLDPNPQARNLGAHFTMVIIRNPPK